MRRTHRIKAATKLRTLNKWIALIVILAIACSTSLSAAGVAHAQDGEPDGQTGSGGADLGAGGNQFVEVIFTIVKRFIQVLAMSSLAIFAAALARGAFSAQLANLVGSPVGMSQAWMNILAAIFLFIIAVFSPLFVDMVFSVVKGPALAALSNPIPPW